MIGKEVSHYRILEKLGEGGMGVVYKAEDTSLDRMVALKFLATWILGSDEGRARFVREAKVAASLGHPNICTVHEIGEAGGHAYIAMEYVEGQSLKDRIKAGPLKLEEALDVAIQIGLGLQKAHEKGTVHRDIKPANVMLTPEGQVKILDFGLAMSTDWATITKTGTTLGTVAYMSPEQVQGKKLDRRTDIWSLGVLLYEILAGRLPFEGAYEQAFVHGILNSAPEPVRNFRPEVPVELERVLEKSLAKEPAGRYQEAGDMIRDLRSLRKRMESKTVLRESRVPELQPSIAVLPFVNISPDPGNEYFGDGLAEELINALAKVQGLQVAARTSAFLFRNKGADIKEIGSKLNVNTILEGSVRRAGSRVRVTAQLVNVSNGYHLWSDRYDRELEDIFAIQEDIARAIVGRLKVVLVAKADAPIVKRPTENLEAYGLFLKGRYYWYQLTAEGWVKSLEYFQKAIEADPACAAAYGWLSIHFQSQSFWGAAPPDVGMVRSRELAEQALQLDETIAEAHACLAVISFSYDRDWEAAEKEFKRSLELTPMDALMRVNYGLCLLARGRVEEGAAQGRLAKQLDPFSSTVSAWIGGMLCFEGLYVEAIELLREAIELDPNSWQLYHNLTGAYFYSSMFEDADHASRKAVALSGGSSIALADLASALHLSGRVDEGDDVFGRLKEKLRRSYVPATAMATIHGARGEIGEVLAWCQRALLERDPWICWYRILPPCLRPDDPRIDALLRRAGL